MVLVQVGTVAAVRGVGAQMAQPVLLTPVVVEVAPILV
jgi:hypothetical protein